MNSNCKEMEFLIQYYVDGEIKKDDQRKLERHLNECQKCRGELVKLEQLVNSLEQLGERERELIRGRLLNWAKRAVVIASILVFSFAFPFHTNPVSLYSDENERNITGTDWRLTVLATNKEAANIPEHEIIQRLEPKHWSGSISGAALIYPGAVSTFIKRKHSLKKADHIVFVRVPDLQTLQGLFDTIGISGDKVKKTVEFPASVMVKLSSNPEITIFKFPRTEEGVRKWYENWANQILQTSY